MSVRGMYSGGVAADTGGTKLIATMRERVRTMSEPRLREQRWDDAIRALRNATAYLDSDMSKGYALGTLSLQSFDILVTDIETLADEVMALI